MWSAVQAAGSAAKPSGEDQAAVLREVDGRAEQGVPGGGQSGSGQFAGGGAGGGQPVARVLEGVGGQVGLAGDAREAACPVDVGARGVQGGEVGEELPRPVLVAAEVPTTTAVRSAASAVSCTAAVSTGCGLTSTKTP